MIAAVQNWQGYQQALPLAADRLKLAIIGYSQGGHSAISTMIQLLLGHQDSFEVIEVYAGAGPYNLYGSSKGTLEAYTGTCTNQPYCENIDIDVSLPYLVDRIGPANLSYRNTGLETGDLIIDEQINPAFASGFLSNDTQYDAIKAFLQIDSFHNIGLFNEPQTTTKLTLFHSEADRLVPAQNSYDLYDAISPSIDTELNTDVCNSDDMLLIAELVEKAGLIHSLCGFNTIDEILPKL